MKTQQPWKFKAAVCVLALWLASGCANKNNVADGEQVDGYAESTEEVAETATGEEATADATAAEAELFGEGGAEAPPAEGEQVAQDGTTDPAMESLFQETPQDQAATDPNFDELAGKSAQTPTDPGAGGDPLAQTEAVDPNAALTDPAATTASAEPLPTDAAATTAWTDPAAPTDAQAFSGAASFKEEKKASYAGAVAPSIPDRAVTRKGKSLNRYYFLRQGDTSKSVSELIYGDASHSADLKKWNKGRWTPGKVIYYSSPTQPDDAQMVSLYDERSLQADQYTVGKGESMSGIAKKTLGNLSSWKELAVVNGLSSPDTLRRGQTIKYYSNLGSAQPSTPVATTTPEQVQPPAQTAPTTPEPVQPPPQEQVAQAPVETVPVAQDPIAEDLAKPKKKGKKDGLNLAKIAQQNMFAVGMGLGIALLLLSLAMINKRKKGSTGSIEEFNEDAFAAPGKKKRR